METVKWEQFPAKAMDENLEQIRKNQIGIEHQVRTLYEEARKQDKQIHSIVAAVKSLQAEVAALKAHPSNAVGQFKQLPKRHRYGYAGGLGTALAGIALIFVARGGTIKIGAAEFKAPEMSAAGIAAILFGSAGSAYAAHQRGDE